MTALAHGLRPVLPLSKGIILRQARNRAGLAEAEFHHLLLRSAGTGCPADLSEAGFRRAMRELRRLAPPGGMASEGQLMQLRALWHRLSLGAGTDAGLRRWLAREAGVDAPRFLTREAAAAAIGRMAAIRDTR